MMRLLSILLYPDQSTRVATTVVDTAYDVSEISMHFGRITQIE